MILPVRDCSMHPTCQYRQRTRKGLPGSKRKVNVDVSIYNDLAQVFHKILANSRHLDSYGHVNEKREE